MQSKVTSQFQHPGKLLHNIISPDSTTGHCRWQPLGIQTCLCKYFLRTWYKLCTENIPFIYNTPLNIPYV